MSCPNEVDEINVIVSGPYPPPCMGCGKIVQDKCTVYAAPEKQWTRVGGCPMRTHNREKLAEEKGFIDPLKASKRSQQKR